MTQYSITNPEEMSITIDKYKAIFFSMEQAFSFHKCKFDDDGIGIDYIFLEMNPSYEKMIGIPRDEMINKNVSEIKSGAEMFDPVLIQSFGRVASTGEKICVDIQFKSTKKWYSISVFSPEKEFFCCLFEDVTDLYQIRTEFELANKQLIEKNRELEQIVFVTSHDLRSPLVNIQGFTRELEMSVDDLKKILQKVKVPVELSQEIELITDEEMPEAMEYIKSGINKMDSLQKGLLTISRLGRMHMEIKTINMNEMIAEVLMNFEYRIKELEIEVEISDIPNCRGDIGLMNQVFSNLLENAIKYRSPERKCLISIEGKQNSKSVTYRISDNGIGVKPENKEKIFEIFYRDKTDQAGEGLGLTMVKKVIEKHHGTISVESELGHSSAFIINFPQKHNKHE